MIDILKTTGLVARWKRATRESVCQIHSRRGACIQQHDKFNGKEYIKGVSLLEVMLTIAVSAMIVIIAVNYYTNVRFSGKVNATVLQVKNLYRGALLYYGQARYQGLNTSSSSPACSLSNGLSVSGTICTLYQGNYISQTDLINSWQKGMTNALTLTTSTTSTTLIISLPALPLRACTAIEARLNTLFIDSSGANSKFSTSCSNPESSGMKLTFEIQ